MRLDQTSMPGIVRALSLAWAAVALAVGVASSAPIHEAVSAGDVAQARALLAGDAEVVMARDAQGVTPLRMAAAAGRSDMCAALLLGSPLACYDLFLDSRSVDGKAARASGELATARRMFANLVMEHPDSPEVNFAYGMACASLEDYSFARLAFERVVFARPEHARAHVALAQSHLALGQVELAAESFHRALAFPMPEEVRRAVEDYLGQVEGMARPRRFTWAGRFDVGAFRDDNVNVGPESSIVRIAPLSLFGVVFSELAVGPGLRPIEDSGMFLSGMMHGGYDIAAPAGWGVIAEGRYYGNWLEDTPERENTFYRLAMGMQHTGPHSHVALPVGADRIMLDGDRFVDRVFVAPSWLLATGPAGNMRWLSRVRGEHRDYAGSATRDGMYLSASETATRYLGARRHSISAGLTLLYDAPVSEIFENWGVTGELGGELRLPWRVALYARAAYTHVEYNRREPLAPDDRIDDLLDTSVGLTKRIGYGWSVDLGHRFIDNRSSFDLYEYRRNITTISTSWAF